MESQNKDLVDLLTPEQRSQLIILIGKCPSALISYLLTSYNAANVMEHMRTAVETGFASKEIRKSRLMDVNKPNPNLQTGEKVKGDIEAKTPAHTTPEVPPIPQYTLPELKKLALESFDIWQETLTQRISHAINTKPPKPAEVNTSRPAEKRDVLPSIPAHDLGYWVPEISTPLQDTLSVRNSNNNAALVLHALLLLALSTEEYDARSRTFLFYIAHALHVPVSILLQQESATAHVLIKSAQQQPTNQSSNSPHAQQVQQMEADPHVQKRIEEGRSTMKWKVGLASVAGAVLVGVTGGLAAPLVAAGLGTLLGGIGLGGTVAAGEFSWIHVERYLHLRCRISRRFGG